MAEVVNKWEKEAKRLSSDWTRVCILRLGVVLSEKGGIVKRIEKPFRLGMGVILGDGTQHFSYIHIDDLSGVVNYLVENDNERGIYNVVAPDRKNYNEFACSMAGVFNRKIRIRIPAIVLRIIFGEASVMLTEGQSVYPKRIIDSGYKFKYNTLDHALKDIVN